MSAPVDVLADGWWRAVRAGDVWLCQRGDDWAGATIHDSEEEAQGAADELNPRVFADGRPANAAAAALARVTGGQP